MTEIRIKQKISVSAGYSSILFCPVIYYPCLVFFLLVFVSCGKKNPPTIKAYEKPDAPLSLTAVHMEDNIILSWAYPAGHRSMLEGFKVLRSDGSGFKGIGIAGSDGSSYIDTGFRLNETYRYKLIAVSLKGVLSNESNVITLTPQPPPMPPEHVAFIIKNDYVGLSWNSSGTGVCYNIYRTMDKGKYSAKPLNREPVCTTSYKDAAFPETTIYYTIRPLHKTDSMDEGFPSAEISVASPDFIPSPPSELRFAYSDGKIYLTWKESPEVWVKRYRVFRMTEGDKEFKLISEVNVPSFTDTAASSERLRYMIRAVGPVSESPPLIGEMPSVKE